MDFKLKCIKTKNSPIAPGASAYKGKIYIFEDGRTTWEDGSESCRYDSAEDFFKHNINLGGYFEEVKEMKELTFKEVIANIKEGEVWESTKKTVSLINGAINIERKNKIETYYIYIKESELFKLQRKEYTFQEAFKAYKEGRIPESAINGQILDSHSRIDMRIIEGKWYIND